MKKACDYSNWLKYFDECQEALKNSEGSYLNALEREWRLICEHHGVDLRDGIKYAGKTPLETLEWCMENHTYPPPELLQVICAQFKTYMDGEGNRKLEDVFFGPPKPGAGNYAKRMRHSLDSLYGRFYIFENFTDNKGKTKNELIEAFFSSNGGRFPYDLDYESFLTKYNRWKKYQESEEQKQGRTL